MPFVTRNTLTTLGLLSLGAVVLAIGFIWSGIYDVGADDAHTRPVRALLETMRERSIAARTDRLQPPNLSEDAALIRQGAGNYDAMCVSCHLAPGMAETELSRGLYPTPPNFARGEAEDPREAFWVIKHGIKGTGMPAWGRSMEDEYIWGMVAFLQQLPKLDAESYRSLVASSGGHSHGGSETVEHAHGDDAPAHDATGKPAATAATAEPTVHRHADGKVHVHPGDPTEAPKPAPDASPASRARNEHDHDH